MFFENHHIRLQMPFTLLVSGPSSSGKSTLVFQIIKHRNQLTDRKIQEILFVLPENHKISLPSYIKNDKAVSIHHGLPDLNKFNERKIPYLLVLDDMMSEVNEQMMLLFSRISHHKDVSVIMLSQNFYYNNKFYRSISLNCQYVILQRNPRNPQQISILANQLFPSDRQFLIDSFNDATKQPYKYLLLDFTQRCPNQLRIRTCILPTDKIQNIIYLQTAQNE
jgi:hypothetical protein